jgi:Domain of unknown function (DUF4340)
MKLRTTIFLLAIALALAGLIFFLDRSVPSPRELNERSTRLLAVDPNQVRGFTIHNGEQLIKARNDGDDWKLVAPWNDAADISVVDQLLTAAQFLRPDAVIDDLGKGDAKRDKLRDFGLNKSKLRLKLDGKEMPGEIQFGHETPVEGKSYIRIQDEDAVYVVSDELKNIVSKNTEDFRDHRLLPIATNLIDRIIIRVRGGEIELIKAQDNWQITRPIKARASNEAVGTLLSKINQTAIASFVPNEKANSAGSDNPTKVITLFAGEEEKTEIQIGNSVPSDAQKVFARLPDRNSVIEVDKSFADLLEIAPNDLRDRKIARLNPDLIDRIAIEKSGQPRILLGRTEDQWTFLQPDNSPANGNAVNRLIETINQSAVGNFISDTATDLARYGLDQPSLKLVFSSYSSENTAEANAGETVLSTLVFGKSENGVTYARLEEEPYVFSVSNDVVAAIPATDLQFRGK